MIDEEKFESATPQIVATQVNFLQLAEGKFEIDPFSVGRFAAKPGIPETDPAARYLQTAFNDRHESHQFALFASSHLLLPFAQFFFPVEKASCYAKWQYLLAPLVADDN